MMDGHVDKVTMNEAMLSANTFSVKKEECQDDSCTEDKVYICETPVTIDNAELQDPILHCKIKEYEESACLDNIKTEVTEVQSQNVKIEGGISTNDIKIEFDNKLLYCEHCGAYYKDYCIECGMLVNILNNNGLNSANNGARGDIPNGILEIQNCLGQTGIYALRIIPAGVKFGPFTGLSATECPWEIKGEKFVLDKNKWMYLNWMQYVNPTKNICDGNLHVFQYENKMYYQSACQIQAGDELLVYLGDDYGNSQNKIIRGDFVTTTRDIVNNVYACTFCCLGFSSKWHLTKHKTICVQDTAGKFSIEELMQCQFCNIHLDPKEYFEHHMSFCCERNTRKCILSTPSAQEATTALNGRKRCLHPIYKCVHCKYRTKYQVDLKEHIKQHNKVKMYKCGICNRRFNAKESLSLHVKNTHSYIGGKDNQAHSTTVYSNTHLKEEQLSPRDQKKIFKCSLCVFRAKSKLNVRRHIKTKHLKKFDYKCDSCEYRTNHKQHLEYHIKVKHLNQFDFKCDSCEYRTNKKNNLEKHIKTNHLKEFDFKCDSCEYRINSKQNFGRHIRNKHLKKFDYKCDSCDFGTDVIIDLKKHIKTKHLQKFDFKCDACEYRSNSKNHLELHIKTKHLKEFDFKCNSCEYRTNDKRNLERHMDAKHVKKFDYKCDSCEYRTNTKSNLKNHIKINHLREFDFKCDSCEYGTTNKCNLKRHIKTEHLKEYDYKCDKCQYRTNNKYNFDIHVKSTHLKEFDYKCEKCQFRTNKKCNLTIHIKTKHLKQFDYKCDKCQYRTNLKHCLEIHMKRKHLLE